MEYSLEGGSEILVRTPAALQALLSGLPEAWTGTGGPSSSPSQQAWSPWQVVAHLTSIEESDWIDRARVILEHGTGQALEPVDREAGFSRFRGWDLAALLGRFADVRAANLAALASLVHNEDLTRTGLHAAFGEVTLSQLLATWVVHDLNHLGQIVVTMARQFGDAMGPWRAFVPILDQA